MKKPCNDIYEMLPRREGNKKCAINEYSGMSWEIMEQLFSLLQLHSYKLHNNCIPSRMTIDNLPRTEVARERHDIDYCSSSSSNGQRDQRRRKRNFQGDFWTVAVKAKNNQTNRFSLFFLFRSWRLFFYKIQHLVWMLFFVAISRVNF